MQELSKLTAHMVVFYTLVLSDLIRHSSSFSVTMLTTKAFLLDSKIFQQQKGTSSGTI